jgi:hypothetical protein
MVQPSLLWIFFLLASLCTRLGFAASAEEMSYEMNCEAGNRASLAELEFCAQHTYRFAQKNPKLYAVGHKGTMEVWGMDNLLFAYNREQAAFSAISGSRTMLHQIIMVAFNEDTSQILVLNQGVDSQKSILLFNGQLSGNLAPLKLITLPNDEQINSIDQISFSFKENTVKLIDSERGLLFKVDTSHDSRSRNAVQQINLTPIEQAELQSNLKLAVKGKSNYIFRYKQDILITTESLTPLYQVDFSQHEDQSILDLHFDPESKKLVVLQPDDLFIVYQLD